jgi:hypothetical protein
MKGRNRMITNLADTQALSTAPPYCGVYQTLANRVLGAWTLDN